MVRGNLDIVVPMVWSLLTPEKGQSAESLIQEMTVCAMFITKKVMSAKGQGRDKG